MTCLFYRNFCGIALELFPYYTVVQDEKSETNQDEWHEIICIITDEFPHYGTL